MEKEIEELVNKWEARGHISPQYSKEVIIQELIAFLQEHETPHSH